MGMRAHCVAAAGEGWFIETQGLAPPGPAGHQATLGPPALAAIFIEQVVASAMQETPTAPRADRGAARRHPPPKRKSTAGRCIASTHPTQPGVPRSGSRPGPRTTTTTTGTGSWLWKLATTGTGSWLGNGKWELATTGTGSWLGARNWKLHPLRRKNVPLSGSWLLKFHIILLV